MEVKAKAKFIRIAPRKVRLVIDLIRGLDAKEALHQLKFNQKRSALPVRKLLESAIANAVNNNKLDKNNLYIKEITANDGPTLKRWMPRAFGRATTIRKRSTHIYIVLAEKVPTEPKKKEEKADKKSVKAEKNLTIVTEKPKEGAVEEESEEKEIKEEGKMYGGKKKDKKTTGKGFASKMFHRKSGS